MKVAIGKLFIVVITTVSAVEAVDYLERSSALTEPVQIHERYITIRGQVVYCSDEGAVTQRLYQRHNIEQIASGCSFEIVMGSDDKPINPWMLSR